MPPCDPELSTLLLPQALWRFCGCTTPFSMVAKAWASDRVALALRERHTFAIAWVIRSSRPLRTCRLQSCKLALIQPVMVIGGHCFHWYTVYCPLIDTNYIRKYFSREYTRV